MALNRDSGILCLQGFIHLPSMQLVKVVCITKTQMLNQIHNRHQCNTDDDGGAMGERLYVQMSRLSMHI